MEDRARVWIARILAPVAFLAAATALVILVQRALDSDSPSGGTTAPVTTVAESGGTAETAATTGAGREVYRIRAGDTLEGIASRFDTTVERLLQLNPGIDPLTLTPGDRIRVS